MKIDRLQENLIAMAKNQYQAKEQLLGTPLMRQLERLVRLQVIDEKWREHLNNLDALKEGINLRAYGQKDPLIEYKRECYSMFMELSQDIDRQTIELLFKAHPVGMNAPKPRAVAMQAFKPELAAPTARQLPQEHQGSEARSPVGPSEGERPRMKPVVHTGPKVGRNDPCPCDSGKKYKKCCGVDA
jgi:preprotein translocase subunit SecA